MASACAAALLAIRLADGLWGLVANYRPDDARQMRCLLCRKNHCPHTSALDAGKGGADGRMDPAAFHAALEKHMDLATGKRRVG